MEIAKHKNKEGISVKNIDGQLVVSSRDIAIDFEKEHKNVIRDIENIIKEDGSILSIPLFIETQYQHHQNKQWYKEYLLTRDGFSLLVMGFNGSKALKWKLKYIEAFNQMEQTLKNPYGHLSKEVQAIFALDSKQQKLESEVKDLKENMPLFNVECKELQALVRKKGVEILGGKGSVAYKDNSTRGKVYSDIQQQLKREFGVTRYEAIKRGQLDIANDIVQSYKAPIYLVDEIYCLNEQISTDDVAATIR